MVLATTIMSKKQKIILGVVFGLSFIFQLLPVIFNAFNYGYGLSFWGSNGHDAIWHLSLINHLVNPFKITLPILSGHILKNYHPFFDILIAFLAFVTRLPSTLWYFQLFPIFSTFLFLATSFLIGKKICKNFYGGLLLLFLNSFANSFGWIVTLWRSGQIGGESLFWAMQSASNQLNPPFLLSLVFINFLLLLLLDNKDKIKFKNLYILLILLLTPITKAYAGVVAYSLLGLYSLVQIKKTKAYLYLTLLSLPLAYFIFGIYNSTSASLFIFKPFWFTNSLIESPDRLYLPFLANARYTLESSGRIGPRLVALYLISIGLFYLGNFAFRLLGLLSLKTFKNSLKLPLFLTILLTALIPLFFIQKGTSWNTIQFLYYSLFLANIFLTYFLINLKNTFFKKILLIVIISSTLLSNYESLSRYLSHPSPSVLPNYEIEALSFLKKQAKGIVLTYPYDKYAKQGLKTPLPLYLYETTAYVSAFSGHQVFLEDEMNLEITDYDWQPRLVDEKLFFSTDNQFFARGFLINNQIDYIYLVNQQSFLLDPFKLQVDLIYDNGNVKIYRVQK